MQLSWPLLKKSEAWTWQRLGPLLLLTLLMETPLFWTLDRLGCFENLSMPASTFFALLLRLRFGGALTKLSNKLTHSKNHASKVNSWITRESLQRASVCNCGMEVWEAMCFSTFNRLHFVSSVCAIDQSSKLYMCDSCQPVSIFIMLAHSWWLHWNGSFLWCCLVPFPLRLALATSLQDFELKTFNWI